MFKQGERVVIAYTGYHIEADIISGPRDNGWYMVEQVTDYEDQEERPRFEAAAEYFSLPGEPIKPGPFEVVWRNLA